MCVCVVNLAKLLNIDVSHIFDTWGGFSIHVLMHPSFEDAMLIVQITEISGSLI